MSTYLSVGDLKATLTLNGESYADADIGIALSAASRGVEKATKRRFWADPDATSVRYYTARSGRRVELNDVIEITEIAVGPGNGTFPTVLTENTHFTLEPLNAAVDDKPWTSAHALRGWFPTCRRGIRVTGRFGWPAVPDEVVLATSIIATKLLKRMREAPFGIVTFGHDAGEVARIARNDPDVLALIGNLTRLPVR